MSDFLFLAIDNQAVKFWKNLFGFNRITKEKVKKVKNILKDLGILETENKLARDLSHGQKRLVELARALLNYHELLMLDEPVAGVNPKIREDIAGLLLSLKGKEETILLIEHDMTFVSSVADEIIVVDAGKVIARGTPDEIKNNRQVLEVYLGG